MDDIKLDLADLNFLRRVFFVRSLGFAVVFFVPWQINVLCASTEEQPVFQ